MGNANEGFSNVDGSRETRQQLRGSLQDTSRSSDRDSELLISRQAIQPDPLEALADDSSAAASSSSS
ncbi:MAG: hypothetical protein Q8P67_04240, partial [archaeon]|nr:hypothetical protein [archaeon]